MPYRNPEAQRAYKREWARMNRTGSRGTPGGTLPAPFRLQTAQDILILLQEQVDAVRADDRVETLGKARCIGYLASIGLRAVEVADVSGRIEALEQELIRRTSRG